MTDPKRLSTKELRKAYLAAIGSGGVAAIQDHIAALEAELAEARAVSNQRRELLGFYAIQQRPRRPRDEEQVDDPWVCLLCEAKADTGSVVHQPQCPAAPEEPMR